ncbi:Maf family protein [Kaarinaea lacus]
MAEPQIYLASSSPRRRELLAQLGVLFEVISQDVPEMRAEGETPENYVERLALEKARAGLLGLDDPGQVPVLGADTEVVVDDRVMGKPVDRAHAIDMLLGLSDRQHRVLSAVAVVGRDNLGQDRGLVRLSESLVTFRSISRQECAAYWDTGEPADKAGAYAIQGKAAVFIERLEGSYSGVMGLPLFETGELLGQFGIEILK